MGVLSLIVETVLETVIDFTLGSFVGIFLEILRFSGMRRDMHEASSMKAVRASLGDGEVMVGHMVMGKSGWGRTESDRSGQTQPLKHKLDPGS
jgi:hypothetical protein